MRVAVLGDSLVSRHFVKLIHQEHDYVQVFLWTYLASEAQEFDSVQASNRFVGFRELHRAITAVDIVVNMHECSDVSISPNLELLKKHNVTFVQNVIYNIRCPLIHISTAFIQCSDRWPNVHESEKTADAYISQWPFPEYCASRHEAEQYVEKSGLDAFILRCVPAYGEGDTCSVLTDLIKFGDDEAIHRVGDGHGVMQMAYSGNIASAVWLACCKMLATSSTLDLNQSYSEEEMSDLINESSLRSSDHFQSTLASIVEEEEEEGHEECVNIFGDRTRLSTVQEEPPVLETAEELLAEEDVTQEISEVFTDDSAFVEYTIVTTRVFEVFLINDNTVKGHVVDIFSQLLMNGKRKKATSRVPLLPVYFFFWLFGCFLKLTSFIIGPSDWTKRLPSAAFLYFYFHHWTFFNTLKSQMLLENTPIYDSNESLQKCKTYYNNLRAEDVPRFSWENTLLD